MDKKHSTKLPIRTIIITALITAVMTWGTLYMIGYHMPHTAVTGGEPLMGEAGKQLWTCGMHPWIITEEPGLCPICNMELTPKRNEQPVSESSGERQVAYWRAPMDPMEIYDMPGKSKMGMDLVPVYEDELIGGVEIRINPVTEQNMGVRTAQVEKGPLSHTVRTYGHITYDETRTAQISPKVDGWLEKLYASFTGEIVEKDQPLFEIYSPQLLAAQEEYLTAFRNYKRSPNLRNREMRDSARRRLSYFDVAESEIQAIEAADDVKKTVMIRSPFKGVVTHKNAVKGGFVKAGTNVYTIADLSRVWAEAHIYEYELDRVAKGQDVEMSLPYHPGKLYQGKVTYVYPYLQQKTRDVVIRLEFENPDLELKPDMYADVRIKTTGKGDGLIIPSEAVIRSGERNVVFVAQGNGRFIPRETTLGMSLDGGRVQILSGLGPGETVVTSGQFLLDSESKLKEAVQKMMAAKSGPAEPKKTEEEEDDFFGDMK
ncbi:efflux RND transporter periplasmic adaptor subun it [Desulfonema ishimotonii]|uniref:Efflux RND transporter periplasmic adaptor subun it n=1 Tax=Desulfonema ishimotonii TaxID=45657 RepID=A0A401FTN1_9BACT|nr:efflux RND transporter periplasmic adaptor subunit [Desulfonema ishimotonii]GBC60332.1 efflux RND transporter periplasmic adaptor subun it [Desulfonema ishimotonii]